jgi:trigger factor
MQVTREDLNPCTVQLTVVCPPEVVKEGFARAIRHLSKHMRIAGFRPGTAPRHLVEPNLTPQQLNQQAADEILRMTVKKVVEEQKLEPVEAPFIDVKMLKQEPPQCEYVAKVPLAPIVELGDYKGIPAESPSTDVTDEEVEYHLEELRKRQGKREAITSRGAQEGDNAVVGIRPEEEGATERKFMVIVGQTFPDLDAALTGMKAEEMKNAELTFPEQFQEKDWAGTKKKCLVTLRSLNAISAPELDDAFAQSLQGDMADFKSENLAELKAKIKLGVENAKKQALQEYLNDQILDEILRRSRIEVPDTMWEDVAMRQMREEAAELAKQGISYEEYAKRSGMTLEEMIQKHKDEAKLQVQRAVMIRQIMVQEKFKLVERDLHIELYEMAHEYGVQPVEMAAMLRKNKGFQELEFRAMYRKVTAFLRDNADIKKLSPAGKA